jgi:hypothetical protein
MKRQKQVRITEAQMVNLVQKQIKANCNEFVKQDHIKQAIRAYFDVAYSCACNEIRVPMPCTFITQEDLTRKVGLMGEIYCYANRGRKEGDYRVPQARTDGWNFNDYRNCVTTHMKATPPYGRIKMFISKRARDMFKERTLNAVHFEEPIHEPHYGNN